MSIRTGILIISIKVAISSLFGLSPPTSKLVQNSILFAPPNSPCIED